MWQWLSENMFIGFIIAVWALTLIIGHAAGFYVGELAQIKIFSGASVCFSAITCVQTTEILKELKEKKP